MSRRRGDTRVPDFAGWREVARERIIRGGRSPRLQLRHAAAAGRIDPIAKPARLSYSAAMSGSTAARPFRPILPADRRARQFRRLHLGHQAVVGEAVARARREGRPALVATFDPHPVRHFVPDTPPFRLTTLDQRERLFAEAGADAMLVVRVRRGARRPGCRGVRGRAAARPAARGGRGDRQDFTFGRRKSGDADVLARLGARHGFSATAVAPVTLAGEPVSSSRIRAHLRLGETREAARLLTRPFTIAGMVEHGDKVGRTIGYPTANLQLGQYLRPAYGIYAVRGRLDDGRVLNGAANLGIRPQFTPLKELLEPYFFAFHRRPVRPPAGGRA